MIQITLLTHRKFTCDCLLHTSHCPILTACQCPICEGLPGCLPIPNAQAFAYAITLTNALQSIGKQTIAFLRTQDSKMARGWHVATESFGERGTYQGVLIKSLWLQEGVQGEALLCLDTDLSVEQVAQLCMEHSIPTSSIGLMPSHSDAYYPYVDLPPVAL